MKIQMTLATLFMATSVVAQANGNVALPSTIECSIANGSVSVKVDLDETLSGSGFKFQRGSAEVLEAGSSPLKHSYVEARRRTDGSIIVIYPLQARPATLLIIDSKLNDADLNKDIKADLYPGPRQGTCRLVSK